MSLRHLLLIFVAIAAVVPKPAIADRITLSNGRVIEGRVIAREGSRVVVESGGMVTRLNASSIQSVQRVEDYVNTLQSAEAAFRRRDVAGGIDQTIEAIGQGAPIAEARATIDRFAASMKSAVEAAREQDKIPLRRSMRKLLDEDLLTTTSMIQTARSFRALDDWDTAAEVLDRVSPEGIADDPIQRQWALEFMRGLVKRQLARGDFENAIAVVEKMRRIAGDDGSPEIPLAHLARAAAARDRKEYTLAFSIIARDLAEKVPEIARNRAIYAIEDMKKWSQDTRKFREARESLFPIRRVFPVEAVAAQQYFITMEVKDDLENADSAAALELSETVPEKERSEDLTLLHNEAFHQEAMKLIKDSNPIALLNHGRWCAANGLRDEAMRIFNKTRENASLRDVSDELLANTRRERDTKLLEEAQSFMNSGNLGEVFSRTQKILTNPEVGSSVTVEAKRLEDLAKKSINRENEARPYRAEAYFQQAERDYFSQNYQGALNLVTLIMNEFSETPAAKRATNLLPDVVRSLELSYLEGKISTLPTLPPQFSFDKIQRTDRLGDEVGKLLETATATR